MKPIYFPFTFVSEKMGRALCACFRQTAVYQASQQSLPRAIESMIKNRSLELHIPVTGDEENLRSITKEYKNWVQSHQGSELIHFKSTFDKIPFFDESFVAQIKADIKKQGLDKKEKKEPDTLFNARMFLYIAHEFDFQKDKLTRELSFINKMEQNLFQNLKGESGLLQNDIFQNTQSESDDPGRYMIQKRLKAWNILRQVEQPATGLFVTGSTAVIEHLNEGIPEMESIKTLDSIPVVDHEMQVLENWKKNLIHSLESLATTHWPVSADDITDAPQIPDANENISLKIFIIPNKTPDLFFPECAKNVILPGAVSDDGIKYKNTIIVFIKQI